MKLTFLPVTAAVLALVSLVQVAPAQAGDASSNPLADFQTQTPSDPFSSRGDNSSGMMDFIHRAMQGPVPDLGAFSAANRENLNDAASAFRAKQQKLLQQRQLAQGANPQGGLNQGVKVLPSGTILLPGALSNSSLILVPNLSLPAQAIPVQPAP